MSEENAPQKERYLREVEQKLLRKELDARLLEDGLIHVRWNEKPLCSVDRDGIVRFRPADITGPEVDKRLRTVIQAAGQVKEYMRIFERAPALKAAGLEDSYKVLADFSDAVLAGQLGKKGAVTEILLEYGKTEVQILFEPLSTSISSMELPKNFENKKLPNTLR